MINLLFPRKRDRIILLPAVGAQLVIGTSLFLLPVLTDALGTHAGLSGRAAGLLLSMELAIAALTTIALSLWFPRYTGRRFAMYGGMLAIAATAFTLVSPALPVLVFSRFLAGVGAGIVGAGAMRVLSLAVDRERLIAIVTIVSIVDAAAWLAVLPYLVDRLGYRGPYICLLLVCLVGTVLLRRLPKMRGEMRKATHASGSPASLSSMLVVAAVFLTQLGQGAFWSMEETFGSNAGFSSHAIGAILSISTLILLLGAVGAAFVEDRYGRYRTLLILLTVNAFAIFLAGMVAAQWVYVAANILQALTNLSSVIYQLGLSASLDRFGRTVAVSTALVTLGNGMGPGLSAGLIGVFGATSVPAVVLGLNAAALTLYCIVRMKQGEELKMSPSLT